MFIPKFNKAFDLIIHLSVIVAFFIPFIYAKDYLLIGGDVIMPFFSHDMSEYLYQWLDRQSGEYYSLSFYFQYFFYWVLNFFTSNIYYKTALFLFILRLCGVLGVYLTIKKMYGEKYNQYYSLVLTFFLISPVFYNSWTYAVVYYLIPLYFYVLIRIFKNKNISFFDIILMSLLVIGLTNDFPNPKYIFYAMLFPIVMVATFLLIDKKEVVFIFKQTHKVLYFLLINSYIIVPTIYFVLGYSASAYKVNVKSGYVSDEAAAFMGEGSIYSIDKIFRLFHDGLNFNGTDATSYTNGVFTHFFQYVFLGFLGLFLLKKKKSAFDFSFIVLVLLFMVLATGPNQPLGDIYKYLVTHFGVFAFLRTTAGAVFFLVPLFAIIIYDRLKSFNNQILTSLFFVSMLVVARPILNGSYYKYWYKNFIEQKELSDVEFGKYGIKIPQDYFKIKEYLDYKKIDSRLYIPHQNNLVYSLNRWGYFGPASMYTFLYSMPIISTYTPNWNTLNILEDKSLIDSNKVAEEYIDHKEFESGFLKLYKAKTDFKLNVNSPDKTQIEYKKVNPGKYKVILHNINETNPIVLNLEQNYHGLWNILLLKNNATNAIAQCLDDYKVLYANDDNQADKETLLSFLKENRISTLGDCNFKTRELFNYANGGRKVSSIEKYKIDFISKDYFGTIQNENIRDSLYETWPSPFSNSKMISADNHFMTKNDKNGWNLNIKEICNEGFCETNNGGLKDLSLVIEFNPQKVFFMSLVFSIVILLMGFVIFLLGSIVKQKRVFNF